MSEVPLYGDAQPTTRARQWGTRGLSICVHFTWSLEHKHDREIGNLLPNNRRQRRTCYALCHILYPVSAALTSIFRMDSNSTSYHKHDTHSGYRGTSLIRNCLLIGPYSRPMPRALRKSWGGAYQVRDHYQGDTHEPFSPCGEVAELQESSGALYYTHIASHSQLTRSLSISLSLSR